MISAQSNNNQKSAKPKEKFQRTTFALSEPTFELWIRRLPRYGDRSKALQRMVEMFLAGEIVVKLPEKTL